MISQHFMLFNIGGLELGLIIMVFIMLFGADKIPEIARGIGKGMKSIRHATDDIKREISESASNIDGKDTFDEVKKGVKEAKETFEDISGSIKRNTKI